MNRIVVLCCMLLAGLQLSAQQVKLSGSDSVLIKQLFFAGLKDKLNANYAKSNESFSQITTIDAGNAPAWYEIALLNFRQNKMPEAEEAIKKATEIDPDNLWYWKLLAEVYKSTGNMDSLIPIFDQLIRLAPDQQNYYFDKANAFSIAGKKEEAKDAYSVLEKKFGSSPALDKAMGRLDSIEHPADAMAVATLYIAKKNFTAAGTVLESIAKTHQDDPLFLALYGDVLYENGNLPAALNSYQKTLKINSQLYSIWEKVLNIQILLGQFAEMAETGKTALSLYPNQAILYYYMAFALHRENQNNLALAHIKSALELDGDNKELQALIFALQAEILIDEHKTQAADVAFEKALQLDPQNYLIMNNYAYYLALRNVDLNKAASLIDVAARGLPDDASIADTYALILFKGGKYVMARTWIEKALQNNEEENSVYLEHYGDILFFIGDTDQALLQWKKSRDAGNDSALLKRKINEKKYFK
ncbi:tetratricopeptide repeat protein [Pedobacter sp. L105]|uniref:tetratricopeptide repeat protein n=1 Tax=Pedobacter sp. L105 TaxID=1641871 RepID=UPI00131C7683|nr:tetratricopeptide repeat protein [Pedobacter sp. L105]